MDSYFSIDIWGMLVAILMVCIAAGISVAMKMGVAKGLLWSTARSLIQLLVMGYVLAYVIRANNGWLVVGLICLMTLAAAQITMSRASNIPKGLTGTVLLALVVTMLLMLSIVAEAIVRPHPWYAAQLVIPITGMLLGNTVSAISLALTRFFDSMRSRSGEVQTLLALGATKWEAARPSMVSSIKMGLLPSIAMLASSGIVTIPGMMSGQVIAGKSPIDAAKYQFVMLAAIGALTLLADSIIVALVYKRCFVSFDRYFVPPPAPEHKLRDILVGRRAAKEASGKSKSASTR